MRYVAAPIEPVIEVDVGEGLGVGLGAWGEPVEEEQPASSSIAAMMKARLTEVKPRPPGGHSDVGARLASIDRDARPVEEARLLRADEHDHARDLFHRPEPP